MIVLEGLASQSEQPIVIGDIFVTVEDLQYLFYSLISAGDTTYRSMNHQTQKSLIPTKISTNLGEGGIKV